MSLLGENDMASVLRLTKAGKLADALALLQGKTVASDAQPPADGASAKESRGTNAPTKPASATIDMTPPSAAGGAWTAPHAAAGPADREAAPGTNAFGAGNLAMPEFAMPDLAETMRAFRERFGEPAPLSTPGGNFARQTPATTPDGARFEERSLSTGAGTRTYKVFVPSGYSGQALPLVVMLHGCQQDPDDFAAGTRMNALAEEMTVLVAYPRQPQSANVQKCWNWFNAAEQARGGGEPSSIAAIAQAVVAEFGADPRRVYAAGLSAGGAAAAIMAATYPDVFAAVGVHSGLACGAAKDMPSAFAAMSGGGAARSARSGPSVPTIVFHGDGDQTVNAVNGDRVIAQAMPGDGLAKTVQTGTSPGGIAYTRTVHTEAGGRAALEQWVLHGAGHAWAGGSAAGSFTDPRGPDASREMLRFFLEHTREG